MLPIEEDPAYAADLLQMSKAENYRRWQFEIVAPYVRGRVLEVGGGIGNFTPELAAAAKWVTSIEPNEYCRARLVEKTKGLPNVQVFNVAVEALDKQVSAADGFDTIILMNVLEHIKDDEEVLRRLKQRLAPGGRVAALVPACPWAFGSIDQRLGHFRRYSKTSARDLMAKLSLELEKCRYYNFIGIWAWWWNAKVARRQSQNDAQIRLFDRFFVPLISRVEKVLPPPLGQSVLVVGRQTQT
jgi:SAM-dependent methyltransferase